MSTLAQRSIGTAFEILYHRKPPQPVREPSKQDLILARERERSSKRRERERAARAARKACTPEQLPNITAKAKALRDNKTASSWTNY